MKRIEIIIRTTEDNLPPHEKVILSFVEQENPRYIKTISNLGYQFMPLDEL